MFEARLLILRAKREKSTVRAGLFVGFRCLRGEATAGECHRPWRCWILAPPAFFDKLFASRPRETRHTGRVREKFRAFVCCVAGFVLVVSC